MREIVAPGMSERGLLAAYYECVGNLGVPSPPSESVAFVTTSRGPVDFRFVARDRPIGDGELVVLSPGALYAGYEADVGTAVLAGATAPRGAGPLAERCRRASNCCSRSATRERPVPTSTARGSSSESPFLRSSWRTASAWGWSRP
jgi:hypothetical protein